MNLTVEAGDEFDNDKAACYQDVHPLKYVTFASQHWFPTTMMMSIYVSRTQNRNLKTSKIKIDNLCNSFLFNKNAFLLGD
jgi:hypothetical protein